MFRVCSRVVVCDGVLCVFCSCVFVGGFVRVFVYVCFRLRVRVFVRDCFLKFDVFTCFCVRLWCGHVCIVLCVGLLCCCWCVFVFGLCCCCCFYFCACLGCVCFVGLLLFCVFLCVVCLRLRLLRVFGDCLYVLFLLLYLSVVLVCGLLLLNCCVFVCLRLWLSCVSLFRCCDWLFVGVLCLLRYVFRVFVFVFVCS